MSNVVLVVDGREYGGWKSIGIEAGIDRVAREFRLGVTSRYPGQAVATRVVPGDQCQAYIDSDLVLSGYVDGTPIDYGSDQFAVGVVGRSKTGDLVDCSAVHSSGQWQQAKVERVSADLARPFGVAVKAEVPTGAVIANHKLQYGETAFESIDRLISQRALLATDDAEGKLLLTRAGTNRAADALELGVNIKAASAPLDFRDCYSEYRVTGQRAGSDVDYGQAVSSIGATAKGVGVNRYRPLLLQLDGPATPGSCKDRAVWEAGYRRGSGYAVTYTVQGWRQSNGALWLPNMLTHVRDSVIGYDAEMLISAVAYVLDDQGAQVRLSVAPLSAYQLNPDIKPDTKSGDSLIDPGATLVKFE
ncbi:MAG: contractile injection system protein, VgrG/Pvc8 family [Gammaproteobacteria bacterium]|nr:contractile injection system protein, VgrG/Pvc8 family [Gammaproteobacteria bacterium]